MARYLVENEKYLIRPIEDGDKDQVKNVICENKYIKRLMSLEKLADSMDSVIQSVYLESDSSYCIISKDTGAFCGYMDINSEGDSDEGEFSISLSDEVNICEIMAIIGDVFKALGYSSKKSITLQYSFE